MAAVTRGTRVKPVTPAAYEYNEKKLADVDILAGQLVKISATGVGLNPTSGTTPSGIALMDTPAGMLCEFTRQGEIDGFSGLTPGATIYPSASAAGGLDTTVLASTVCLIEAVTATRVYFRA